MPQVRVVEDLHELLARLCLEVVVGFEFFIFPTKAVDAPGSGIDLALVVLSMCDVFFPEIGDDHTAVGRVGEVDWSEGEIGAAQGKADIAGLISAAVWGAAGGDEVVMEGIGTEEMILESRGHGAGTDDNRHVGKSGYRIGAAHHRQLTEGEGVWGRTEFPWILSLLEELPFLDVVPAARLMMLLVMLARSPTKSATCW